MAKEDKKASGATTNASSDAELEKMMEEEAAAAATKAAMEAASQEIAGAGTSPLKNELPPPPPRQFTQPKPIGDIPVVCLKSESFVNLGNRRYQFLKGQEIMMDPGHAEEMAQAGWVSPIDVVT